MFIEYWMLAIIVGMFGACAYFSHTSGSKSGVLLGIEGTFEYLEKHGVIKFMNDGSIQGVKKKITMNRSFYNNSES